MLGKHPLQQGRVADIALDERRRCASDALHRSSTERRLLQRLSSTTKECQAWANATGMRANEVWTARYKNHAIALLKMGIWVLRKRSIARDRPDRVNCRIKKPPALQRQRFARLLFPFAGLTSESTQGTKAMVAAPAPLQTIVFTVGIFPNTLKWLCEPPQPKTIEHQYQKKKYTLIFALNALSRVNAVPRPQTAKSTLH